jgi:putative membrane protein
MNLSPSRGAPAPFAIPALRFASAGMTSLYLSSHSRFNRRIVAWGTAMILASLNGLPAFLLYFVSAMVLIGAFAFIYQKVTPHDEIALIRANVAAAAISFSLSILGFAIPLASAIAHSVSLLDMLVWGVIALIVQLGVYFTVRLLFPDISKHIADGEISAGLALGMTSLSAGLINAACMTY